MREGPFCARPAQAPQPPAHHGHAAPHARLGRAPGTQLLQRRIGMIAHQALADSLGGRAPSGLPAAGVGLWAHVPDTRD